MVVFSEPTMQKLGFYLERVTEWEAFGYQLLPEDKGYLVEVSFCSSAHESWSCSHSFKIATSYVLQTMIGFPLGIYCTQQQILPTKLDFSLSYS